MSCITVSISAGQRLYLYWISQVDFRKNIYLGSIGTPRIKVNNGGSRFPACLPVLPTLSGLSAMCLPVILPVLWKVSVGVLPRRHTLPD